MSGVRSLEPTMPALRLLVMLLAATVTVLWRRLRGASRCPRWTLVQEVMIDVQRRNGLCLMRLGPERARRHLAAISPRSAREGDVSREAILVDGLRGEWTRPRASTGDDRVVLYYYGGGYVF